MHALWKWYRDKSFILKITVGFLLGIIAGLALGPSAQFVSPLGDLFLRLLQMIIVPLILFTLIGAVNSSNPKQFGRVGVKIFIYYMLTTAIAMLVGIIVGGWFNPGVGLELTGEHIDVPEAPSFIDTMLAIVPTNIFQSLVNGDILSIVFVALITGFVIVSMRHSEEKRINNFGTLLYDFSQAGSEVTFRILNGILQYAPIGIFAIAASKIGEQGYGVLYSLAGYVGASYVGVIIQFIFVYLMFLLLLRVQIKRFFKGVWDALITAFTTSSSLATLPVAIKAAEKAGIRESVSKFTLPLGAAVNSDGSAIHYGVGAIFAANVVGMELSFAAMVAIVLAGTVASIGTAGVPGAGLIGLSIVLTEVGLPIEIVALTAGVNVITDMIFTTCNVTGDLVGAAVVDKSEEKYEIAINPDKSNVG
ncbi:dicarboxylate/amino acid:cation symporter [Oceanobacillus chungangensis]|uniref:dicarboxylate/amino acid:cation symporter n=1 Tax=Oceanobacillus chungangensis TaxID=1229152 RepID=UPI001B886B4D|nr:dicarboxylate/amino acid:cation symporter [Oceanobacillus chungangensis]